MSLEKSSGKDDPKKKKEPQPMTEEEIRKAVEEGTKKVKLLTGNIPKALLELWQDIKSVIEMLRDYAAGRYTQIPWHIITALAGTVAYFVSPLDVIPDFVPVLGYLDDAIVVTIALDVARADLKKYKQWKAGNGSEGQGDDDSKGDETS